MSSGKKALLLVGSPKLKKSASESLGDYFMKGLEKNGYDTEKLNVLSVLKSDEYEIIKQVNSSDLVIISFPLYVDSLPAPMTRALELIAEERKKNAQSKEQGIAIIVNCGFPEAFHNYSAVRICKNFAEKTGFNWLGGLAMGCGPATNGEPVEKLGGMTRNIVKAIEIASEAVANGREIPQEAVALMEKKIIPVWIYKLFGNYGWKKQAKQFNAHNKLFDRPNVP